MNAILKPIHVDDAAAKLKELVAAALNGDDIFLYADDPQRAVRLSPGNMGSLIWMADDFNDPVSEFNPYIYPDPLIRPYEARDHGSVVSLMVELQEYERMLDPNTVPGESSLAAQYLDNLLARCQSDQGMIYVAEVNQQAVGLVSVYRDRDDENFTRVNNFLYVADLIVTESHREQGIATALLAQAEAHARQLQTRFIKLYALANNGAAISAYRKAGYYIADVTLLKVLTPNA